MSLSVTTAGPNPQTPGISAQLFIPDQLIAGPLQIVSDVVTVASGVLKRGTVLGQAPTAVAAAAGATNTGNGTCATLSVGAGVESGLYTLVATSATVFTVAGPDGTAMPNATVGTAYKSAGINFTLTAGGTAFVSGDTFTITVAPGGYIKSVKTAVDGSQFPSVVLADDVDASSGAVAGVPVYLSGEFNANAMLVDTSWGAAVADWLPVVSQQLRRFGIYVKTSVTAADPL